MQTGKITTGLRPDREPLVAFELDDGVAVHAYRNIATDGFLLLAEDGRAFVDRDEERYEQLSRAMALEEAFAGWEQARPRPRDPDAVRALLEGHRAPACGGPA